jgi:carbonic anhydrase/acetyltransferase-like protein (isoleucine patch superfamily)
MIWGRDLRGLPGVKVHAEALIHRSAQIYGDVRIAAGASVWPNVVMRAEMNHIEVGEGANVQDFAMIHVAFKTPSVVGPWCSITHHVTLHGCEIGADCLIGINATIMDGAVIGANSIVAGHAFVREGTVIPPNSIVMGAPASVTRERDNRRANRLNGVIYKMNAEAYAAGDFRVWSRPEAMTRAAAEVEKMLGAAQD